jgi:hypothetical protein
VHQSHDLTGPRAACAVGKQRKGGVGKGARGARG